MRHEVFQFINCREVLNGDLVFWGLRDGYIPMRFDVYGTTTGKEWTPVKLGVTTDQVMIKRYNDGLTTAYKVIATCTDGEQDESPMVQPLVLGRQARILIKEVKRREEILMRAHPYGAPLVYILMRRKAGESCPLCGNGICSGGGGTALNPACPICFGTGIKDGYYLWPRRERMLLVPPKDDKKEAPQEIQRNIVFNAFRTVFDGRLREYDLIVVGNEIYDVVDQTVAASIANAPAAYTLTTKQLAPEEPRYRPLIQYIRQQIGDATDDCDD